MLLFVYATGRGGLLYDRQCLILNDKTNNLLFLEERMLAYAKMNPKLHVQAIYDYDMLNLFWIKGLDILRGEELESIWIG